MSHSVPSDSSAIDATFIIGIDLVVFDRRELPIYATPQTHWMDACYDEPASFGAPVDRLFGEPGNIHIESVPLSGDESIAGFGGDDPLVSLATLADGLSTVAVEAATPELATWFDFGAEVQTVVHVPDGAGWENIGADGTFDYIA